MELIAGRTAQEYNQRRATQGAFWEDRYHATAIEIDEHLHRCVVYIDLTWFAPAWRIILGNGTRAVFVRSKSHPSDMRSSILEH